MVCAALGVKTVVLTICRKVPDIGDIDAVAVENNQEILKRFHKVEYGVHCSEFMITFAARFCWNGSQSLMFTIHEKVCEILPNHRTMDLNDVSIPADCMECTLSGNGAHSVFLYVFIFVILSNL